MGWTDGREVQCGCGWEGLIYELLEHQYILKMIKYKSPVDGALMLINIRSQIKYVCPRCRADLNYQYYKVQFRVKEMPMRPPWDGWYKTTKLL